MANGQALFEVHGMWCGSCARAVERRLAAQPGVQEASVSLVGETAIVRWDPAVTGPDALGLAVERLGYRLVPADQSDPAARDISLRHELAQLQRRLIVALVLGMWIMIPQTVQYLDPGALPLPVATVLGWAGLLLSTFVVAYSGQRFLLAGWRTARTGAPGVDSLVALGALGSLALSAWQLMSGRPERLYLDGAVALVSFLLLGRLLELRIRAHSGDALTQLARQAPLTADVEGPDGALCCVGIRAVPVGAVISVACGAAIPLDGRLIDHGAILDCAWLTGESLPVHVPSGAAVEAGSRNLGERVRVRVEGPAGERRIDRIVAALREFLARKSHLDALADRWSAALMQLLAAALVCAVGLGLLAHETTGELLQRALTVLVVACPCALGLAVPLVLRNVVETLLRSGSLIHDPRAVEQAQGIDLVLFDKTGTLTRPGLDLAVVARAARPCNDDGQGEALQLAARIAAGSLHPLARALGAAAHAAGLSVDDWPAPIEERAGQGILTYATDGAELRLGSACFADPAARDLLSVHGPQVILSRNGVRIATFDFSETLQAGTVACLAALRLRGLQVGILSGDRAAAVTYCADTLAIGPELRWSDCSPEQKAQIIRRLQLAGRRVAFVGDGINDAPALAAAMLGISTATAGQAPQGASALTLGPRGLADVPGVLGLLEAAGRRARFSLAWAALYNVLALAAAVSGWMSPGWAAVAMIASSLSVTINALRPWSSARCAPRPGLLCSLDLQAAAPPLRQP